MQIAVECYSNELLQYVDAATTAKTASNAAALTIVLLGNYCTAQKIKFTVQLFKGYIYKRSERASVFIIISVTFVLHRKMSVIKLLRLQLNSLKSAAQHLMQRQQQLLLLTLTLFCHLATNYLKGYCRFKRHGVNNSKTLCSLTLTLILWSGGIWQQQQLRHAVMAFDIGKCTEHKTLYIYICSM